MFFTVVNSRAYVHVFDQYESLLSGWIFYITAATTPTHTLYKILYIHSLIVYV